VPHVPVAAHDAPRATAALPWCARRCTLLVTACTGSVKTVIETARARRFSFRSCRRTFLRALRIFRLRRLRFMHGGARRVRRGSRGHGAVFRRVRHARHGLLRVRSSRRDQQGAARSGRQHSRGVVRTPGANASRHRGVCACVCVWVPRRKKNGHHVPLIRLTLVESASRVPVPTRARVRCRSFRILAGQTDIGPAGQRRAGSGTAHMDGIEAGLYDEARVQRVVSAGR